MRIANLSRIATALTIIAVLALPALASARDVEARKLELQVRKQLVRLPYFGVFDNLQFVVRGSKVTLLGQTIRPTLKADAERVVARLEGIESIDNQIEVLPVSPHDDRLRLEVFRNIYRNAKFSRLANLPVPPIHIIVKNGNVTLEGVVLSDSDRILAGLLANRALVFSVTNNLMTEV